MSEAYNRYIEDEDFEALQEFKSVLNALSLYCFNNNVKAGWWTDIKTGESLVGKRNIGELLCLAHSEISEAMEGWRKDLMDDKLPDRKMFEVEIGDCIIRLMDICGSMGLDIGGSLVEKIVYNKHREDHKIEQRKLSNGKKF